MNEYLNLALVLILAFSVGFQAGHLLASFQYETCDGYADRRKRKKQVDKDSGGD